MGDREPVPSVLWLVRHGESMGNVADAQAHEAGAGRLELDVRDPDVPLSDTGREQAEALGRWLAALPEDQRPTAALSSPFARALTTAQLEECPHCHQTKQAHHACPTCGWYNGREAVRIKAKKSPEASA